MSTSRNTVFAIIAATAALASGLAAAGNPFVGRWAPTGDEAKPGPLHLQGDHPNTGCRNLQLRPVVK